jgi:hypothetical protein
MIPPLAGRAYIDSIDYSTPVSIRHAVGDVVKAEVPLYGYMHSLPHKTHIVTARVVEISITDAGVRYRVAYMDDCARHEEWVTESGVKTL